MISDLAGVSRDLLIREHSADDKLELRILTGVVPPLKLGDYPMRYRCS